MDSPENNKMNLLSNHTKAGNALKQGKFNQEIAPVTIKGVRGKPDVVVEKMKKLKNSMKPNLSQLELFSKKKMVLLLVQMLLRLMMVLLH